MFLLLYFDVTGCLFVPTDVESSLKKKNVSVVAYLARWCYQHVWWFHLVDFKEIKFVAKTLKVILKKNPPLFINTTFKKINQSL